MSVIIPRRAGKVNIRLARSRSEDIFTLCIRATMTSTTAHRHENRGRRIRNGSGKGSGGRIPRARVQARESRHFYACIHTVPRCILRLPRVARPRLCMRTNACVCECCNAIVHVHTATRVGPDTPDKYLHMGLRGNFLKTQVPHRFLYHRPPPPEKAPRFAMLSFTSRRSRRKKKMAGGVVGKFVMLRKHFHWKIQQAIGRRRRRRRREQSRENVETLWNCRRSPSRTRSSPPRAFHFLLGFVIGARQRKHDEGILLFRVDGEPRLRSAACMGTYKSVQTHDTANNASILRKC